MYWRPLKRVAELCKSVRRSRSDRIARAREITLQTSVILNPDLYVKGIKFPPGSLLFLVCLLLETESGDVAQVGTQHLSCPGLAEC